MSNQGTSSLLELVQELRDSRAQIAAYIGRRRAMDVMERAANAIERLAPLEPDAEVVIGEN